jgi:glyoxylase-like metal-dependent hydrolase (beta-lactamase superfamily II)
MKLTTIMGHSFKLDGGSMFGNAPKAMWRKWIRADRLNRIGLASRALLLSTGEMNILFETGIGSSYSPRFLRRYGIDKKEPGIIGNLKKAGFEESDIDYVIISHLHFDHLGGLISKQETQKNQWEFYFPEAKYIFPLENFIHAEEPHPGDKNSFLEGITDALKKTGRLLLVNEEQVHELGDLIEFHYTMGHTPGQLHSIINCGKQKIMVAGDLIPGIPWINLPVTMGFDRFSEKLINEKKIVMERAIDENWLIFYTHDPSISVSGISRDLKGKFLPVNEIEVLNSYSVD